MRRFFGKLENDKIVISNDEFVHLKKVLRLKENDKIFAYSNDEWEYECKISFMAKDFCECKILSKKECEGLPKKHVTLFQMMPKKEYFDAILPKSIELGVSEIFFFTSKFTMLKNFNEERVKTQVKTACKQCERSKLVPVFLCNFTQMLEKLKDFDAVIFAYENEKEIFDFKNFKSASKIAVIVGNEAGFDQSEADEIKKIENVKSVSLGKRILRCDTAVTAVLALVGNGCEN